MNIHIDTTERWNETLPNYISNYIKGIDIEIPIVCPNCGKFLEERIGKYGKFLGCSGYPDCNFIFNIDVEDKISCPVCGNRLIQRTGKYGSFLGCINYPQCRFTFDLDKGTKKNIYCPKCGKRLVVRSGKQGKFLECTGFPQCEFTFNIGSDVQKSHIERIEKISKVTPINTKRIKNVLSKDLQNIKKLASKLNIKDEMDIRYLQIKLKELERKGFVKMKVSKHEKYWFIK